LVTLNDVLEEITDGLTLSADQQVVQREDGSYLVDARLTVDEFCDALDLPERRAENRHDYNALAGLTLSEPGRIPKTGDTFVIEGLRFEVVDLDGHRVDKLLVARMDYPARAKHDD
jgi:magnesium and cobalt exporter, CNNM family